MKITHKTLKSNQYLTRMEEGNNRLELYFSYETLVGINYWGDRAYNQAVIENLWGSTTGKLLNELEPDKKARLSREDFNRKFQEILNQFNKAVA